MARIPERPRKEAGKKARIGWSGGKRNQRGIYHSISEPAARFCCFWRLLTSGSLLHLVMLVFGALCHSAAWDSEFVMRLSSTRLAGLRPSSSILAGALVTVVSLAAACGGGSSSEGPPPPPPTPDFALGLNPQSISIP